MKEQAEKLCKHALDHNYSVEQSVAKIQFALEAAREEGRKEIACSKHPLAPIVCGGCCKGHDHSTCPDCAKLKAEGAEEKRKRVVDELAEMRFMPGDHWETVMEHISRLLSLAPPKPAVPGWVEAAADDWCNRRGLVKWDAPAKQDLIQSIIAHAPKLDAGRLAEAIWRKWASREFKTTGSLKLDAIFPVDELAAAIQAELEKEG